MRVRSVQTHLSPCVFHQSHRPPILFTNAAIPNMIFGIFR